MASGGVQTQSQAQPKESGLSRLFSFGKRRKSVSGSVGPAEGEVVAPMPPLPKGKQVKFAEKNGSGTKDAVADRKDKDKAAATGTASTKQANNENTDTQDGDKTKDSTEPQETEAQRMKRTVHVPVHAVRDHLLLVHPRFNAEELNAAKNSGRATQPADARNFNFGCGQRHSYPYRETGGCNHAHHDDPDNDWYQYNTPSRSSSGRRSSRSHRRHAAREVADEESSDISNSSGSKSNERPHRQRRRSHSSAHEQDAAVESEDGIRRRASASHASAPASESKRRSRRNSTSSTSTGINIVPRGQPRDVVYVDPTPPPPIPESAYATKERSRRKSTSHANSSTTAQTLEQLPAVDVPASKERSRRKSTSGVSHSNHTESTSHGQTTEAKDLEAVHQKVSTPASEVPPLQSILKKSNSQRKPPGEAPAPLFPSVTSPMHATAATELLHRSKSKGKTAVYRVAKEEEKRRSTNFSRPGILNADGRRDTVIETDPPATEEMGGGIEQTFSFPWHANEPAVKHEPKHHQSRLPRRKSSQVQEAAPAAPSPLIDLTQPAPAATKRHGPQGSATALLTDLMDAPAPAVTRREQNGPFVRDSVRGILDAEGERYVMSGALGDMMEMRDDASSVYEEEGEGEGDLMAFEDAGSESERIWEEEVF